MNLIELSQVLGNFGEFFGAIAVVVTLVYLAVQIRQNSTQLRLNSHQISTERYADLIANVLQDPDKFSTFRDGLQSYSALDPDQQALFHSHLFTTITAYRDNVELVEAGVLSEEILMEQKQDIARILKCPGSMEWLRTLAESFGAEPEGSDFLIPLIEDILEFGKDVVPLNQGLQFLRK